MMSRKEEQEREQAVRELETMLDQNRPKNVGQGLVSGVGYIVAGAIGAAGIAVLAPSLSMRYGAREGGVVGGVVGGVGGAMVGMLAAANVAVGGVVSGVGQVIRGVAATPESIVAPTQGKWWCEAEGKWIQTNLVDESRWLATQSHDDEDILNRPDILWTESGNHQLVVADPYYYDILQIDPSNATSSIIQRQYYILARKYSPDRAGNQGNREVHDKFRELGNAYFVLSDPELRAEYDKHGRDGMLYRNDSEAPPSVDPVLLYGALFGSDKFQDYIGRLAAATSASVGDSPAVSMADARLLQRRRVTRLALKLADRLELWTKDDQNMAKADWTAEAEFLTKASYGTELVHVIGKIYTLAAIQFLGSIESGLGLPSISSWAKAQYAAIQTRMDNAQRKLSNLSDKMETANLKASAKKEMRKAQTDDEKKATEKKLQERMGDAVMTFMWKSAVVDITNTLHEVSQMVLFDQSVTDDIRQKRGQGLKVLGEIMASIPRPEGEDFDMDGQTSYEQIAFSAMLETVIRKDKAAYATTRTK